MRLFIEVTVLLMLVTVITVIGVHAYLHPPQHHKPKTPSCEEVDPTISNLNKSSV